MLIKLIKLSELVGGCLMWDTGCEMNNWRTAFGARLKAFGN
jgi:hypothetical protein